LFAWVRNNGVANQSKGAWTTIGIADHWGLMLNELSQQRAPSQHQLDVQLTPLCDLLG